jgi:hypothetical protein
MGRECHCGTLKDELRPRLWLSQLLDQHFANVFDQDVANIERRNQARGRHCQRNVPAPCLLEFFPIERNEKTLSRGST